MWFVLNYVPPRGTRRSSLPSIIASFSSRLEAEGLAAGPPLEHFAPTFVRLESAGGQVRPAERPLLYHYVFVRGDEADVKKLCARVDGFSFVVDRSAPGRHVSISDEALEHFRIIARYFSGRLPCYPLDGVSLEEGDRVQVISGPFAGLEGTYISKRGGHSGNILLSVDAAMAAVVYDVPADYVRVLEFARDSRRVYDQLDAFASRLSAMCSSLGSRSAVELAAASSFVSRLGVVKLQQPKLAAKLHILLYGACSVLADRQRALAHLEAFRSLEHHVTNPKSLALVSSILSSFPPE